MQKTEVTETPRRKTHACTEAAATPKLKKDQLVDLLRAKGGANIQQLSEALGWLPHTVRAALTGLRKADVLIEKMPTRNGEPTRYRINAKRGRSTQ